MYRELEKVVPRQEFFDKMPGLEEVCRDCWKFYLHPRTKSLKSLDIKLGKQFENAFIEFFDSLGIKCSSDKPRDPYPDLCVKNSSGKTVAYFEVKYLTAPFVKVFQKVRDRECYEGSTTLDVEGKIAAQREVVEKEIDVPVYYAYWLDYPCIKGVFYMTAKKVYEYIDAVGIEWTRRKREGNFVEGKGKKVLVGAVHKVYLPLLKMGDFETFVKELQAVIGETKNV